MIRTLFDEYLVDSIARFVFCLYEVPFVLFLIFLALEQKHRINCTNIKKGYLSHLDHSLLCQQPFLHNYTEQRTVNILYERASQRTTIPIDVNKIIRSVRHLRAETSPTAIEKKPDHSIILNTIEKKSVLKREADLN